MITMAEQGQKINSDNVHGGTAKIVSLSASFISLRCSDVMQVELKMLTKGTSDTVIAVVETVQLPALDSRISFHTTDWKPLPLGKHMKGGMVKMTDFIRKGTPKAIADDVMRRVRFPLFLMTFGKNDGQLVVSQQQKSFLSREDYNKIRPYLIDTITYDIDKTKLKRSKKSLTHGRNYRHSPSRHEQIAQHYHSAGVQQPHQAAAGRPKCDELLGGG